MHLLNFFGRNQLQVPHVTLSCTESDWQRIRDHLLKPDALERAGFGLVGRAQYGKRSEYFLHRFDPVADGDCDQQHSAVVEPKPLVVLGAFDRYARSPAAGLVHLHSHPFCERANFSGIDDAHLPQTARDLAGYLRVAKSSQPARFLRWVTGKAEDGFTIEVLGEDGRKVEAIDEVCVVGPKGIQRIRRSSRQSVGKLNGLYDDDKRRLDRNVAWLGAAGQERIVQTHVAIVGLGGLGSEVAKACRGLGFRQYTLVDHDRIELSNLNRLPWARSDIGRLKVDVVRGFLHDAVPEAVVNVIREPVGTESARTAIADADIIISCLDNDFARLQVQDISARYLRPLLDMGSGITLQTGSARVEGMGGQLSFHIPGGPCLACQGLNPAHALDPEHVAMRRHLGYIQGTDQTPASVVTINAIIAALGVDTLMKWLTGFSSFPSWLRYDLLSHQAIPMKFVTRPDCPICGENGVIGLGACATLPLMPRAEKFDDFFRKSPPRDAFKKGKTGFLRWWKPNNEASANTSRHRSLGSRAWTRFTMRKRQLPQQIRS
jgi:molybdopterin/thiamine biosynthesis adenylyltransferase